MDKYINKVELRGFAGKSRRRGDRTVLQVATEYVYRSEDGCPTIETTWCTVVVDCETQFRWGDMVHVKGRLVNRRYTLENGEDRIFTEIIADEVMVAAR